ncbi:hypothetical protein GNX71_18575 [Variovorax sp. RKNM96]|uniref:hypothetical protein n=1 Tax=Variovorax sp. RKNM96 TaxID=2681552 RepID=UPI00198091B8|nr:hypothetical protein [Variovorax sp. RKNM96]QSI31474.1 hypothetical protein GNX71_18575 [Variovorax sp. RKNM96]
MTTTALLSELEALNIMLQAADEAPVQTAQQAGHLPLSIAKGILNDVSRTVQSKGYAFNMEYDFPLFRDVNGRITLSANCLNVDVNDEFTSVAPITRGLQLYDRKNHTDIFSIDLKATVTFLLGWDSLPQAARNYIAIRAARSFAVRMQTGDLTVRATQAEEDSALMALDALEADQADANFLTDSWSCSQVLYGRET